MREVEDVEVGCKEKNGTKVATISSEDCERNKIKDVQNKNSVCSGLHEI